MNVLESLEKVEGLSMKERNFLDKVILSAIVGTFCLVVITNALEFDKTKIDSSKLRDDTSSLIALDVQKIYNLKVSEGFDIDDKGNIVYTNGEKMYIDAPKTTNDKDESFAHIKIPQIYLRNSDLKTQTDTLSAILKINPSHLPTSLSINETITGLSGKCKSLACDFGAEGKLEKDIVFSVGDRGSGGMWEGINVSNRTINAHNIVAIGGIGLASRTGILNPEDGTVNANNIIAIGGNKSGSRGFQNKGTVTARNIVGIGGYDANNQDAKFFGILNAGVMNANIIIGIAGRSMRDVGIYNLGTMNADIVVGISSENGYFQYGIQNSGTIKSKLMISMPTAKMTSAGIHNAKGGKIETDTLIVASAEKNAYYAFINAKEATLKAKNMYLQGKNTSYIDPEGSVTTNNLFINNITNIMGIVGFDPSVNSLLMLDTSDSKWNGKGSFFTINALSKNDIFTLNANTKINIKLTKEMIMKNNLAYGTPYSILGLNGSKDKTLNATLQDNRSDKKVYFEGLTSEPTVIINTKGISFLIQKGDSDIEPKIPIDSPTISSPSAPLATNDKGIIAEIANSSGLAEDRKQKLLQDIQDISPNAKNILDVIVEYNQRNSSRKFQELTIGEAIKTADIQTLHKLVKETDSTLSAATTNMGTFSLQSVEYLNHRVLNRINSLSFSKNNVDINFKKWVQEYALASNDTKVYMPNFDILNSAWANFGGSYYETPSNASSLVSANATMGYDRKLISDKDLDWVLGGLFNYSIGNYAQDSQKSIFNTYSLGVYSSLNLFKSEFQGIVSFNQLLSDKNVSNETISIENQSYFNNNIAFNFTGFYKYGIEINDNNFIKPLVLMNYSFLYTPASSSDLFILRKKLDHVFALGAGAEYEIQTESMGHILQIWGRYNFSNIENSRSISFRGSQTFIHYDLNPSKIWVRMGYDFKYQLSSSLFLDISLSGDMSMDKDFLVMGNAGLRYVW